MKNNFKFQSVVNKNVWNESLRYVKVGPELVEGSDAFCLFRIPKKIVFGECEFTGYFEGEAWKRQGFHNASRFEYQDGSLQGFDIKGKDLGKIQILTEEQFLKIGRFPDFLAVIPQMVSAIEKISFNPNLLSNLCEAIGSTAEVVRMVFSAENKAIKIEVPNSEIQAILMPKMMTNY